MVFLLLHHVHLCFCLTYISCFLSSLTNPPCAFVQYRFPRFVNKLYFRPYLLLLFPHHVHLCICLVVVLVLSYLTYSLSPLPPVLLLSVICLYQSIYYLYFYPCLLLLLLHHAHLSFCLAAVLAVSHHHLPCLCLVFSAYNAITSPPCPSRLVFECSV